MRKRQVKASSEMIRCLYCGAMIACSLYDSHRLPCKETEKQRDEAATKQLERLLESSLGR